MSNVDSVIFQCSPEVLSMMSEADLRDLLAQALRLDAYQARSIFYVAPGINFDSPAVLFVGENMLVELTTYITSGEIKITVDAPDHKRAVIASQASANIVCILNVQVSQVNIADLVQIPWTADEPSEAPALTLALATLLGEYIGSPATYRQAKRLKSACDLVVYLSVVYLLVVNLIS